MAICIALAVIFVAELVFSWRSWLKHFPEGYDRDAAKARIPAAMADLARIRNVAIGCAIAATIVILVLR